MAGDRWRIEDLLEKQIQKREAEKDPGQLRDLVTWEDWISDDYYSGAFSAILYDFWRDEISAFEVSGAPEWVITGSLGGGKSTAGLAYMSFCITRHTCYRYPNRLYGLGDVSPLVYGYLSTTAATAMETGFRDLVKYIDSAPYFKEQCPRRDLKTKIEFTRSNLVAAPGTGRGGGGSLISRNLYFAMLDEANFYKKSGSNTSGDIKVTQATYQSLMNRRRTRFATDRQGADDSKCVLISSTDHDKSFTEGRINEARDLGEKQHVTIVNPWVAQPGKYSTERFVVFCGSESKPPEVVTSSTQAMFEFDDPTEAEKAVEIHAKGFDAAVDYVRALPYDMMMRFLEVPTTFLQDFRRDPVSALKDIGGKSVKASDKLFSNAPAWTAAVLSGAKEGLAHPFAQMNPCVSEENGVSLRDLFIVDRMFDEKKRLRRHPEAPRFVHVDSSLSDCPTALSMAHQAGSMVDDLTGLMTPVVEYDFNLEIIAPDSPGDEVSLLEILKFILWLHTDMGVKFGKVTYDMYASALQLQVFKRYNIDADRLSIDSNYGYVKDFTRAFSARTVRLYEYPPLKKSLFNVVDDREKQKILRPGGIYKDILDAAIGAHHNCVSNAENYYAGTADQIAKRSFVRRAYRGDTVADELAEDMARMVLGGYDRKPTDRLIRDVARGVEVLDARGKVPK